MKGGDSMKLLFLADNLLDPINQEKANLPLDFVCFAHTEGKMYRYNGNTVLAKDVGSHGNSVVYGAVYALRDEYYHIRTLDALFNCSLSGLGRNHSLDMQHRRREVVTPIHFRSLDELRRLMYRELEPIETDMYVANNTHPTIQKRIERTQKFNYRIKDGINKKPFLAQFGRVQG